MKNVNYICMKFTVGHASDAMPTLEYNFYKWISVWCLSLAGTTVTQMMVFFSWLSLSWASFSLFYQIMFKIWLFPIDDTMDTRIIVRKRARELYFFLCFDMLQQKLGWTFGKEK